jgi:paraquat-inducible protein A
MRYQLINSDRWIGFLLTLALLLLSLGLFMPAIKIKSRIFNNRELSLVDSVFTFFNSGNIFLFLITFLFSIVFPTLKIIIGLYVWYTYKNRLGSADGLMRLLSIISKWSMLDVFIIALVILIVDGRLLSEADIMVGAIVFTVSVILSSFAIYRLNRLVCEK